MQMSNTIGLHDHFNISPKSKNLLLGPDPWSRWQQLPIKKKKIPHLLYFFKLKKKKKKFHDWFPKIKHWMPFYANGRRVYFSNEIDNHKSAAFISPVYVLALCRCPSNEPLASPHKLCQQSGCLLCGPQLGMLSHRPSSGCLSIRPLCDRLIRIHFRPRESAVTKSRKTIRVWIWKVTFLAIRGN